MVKSVFEGSSLMLSRGFAMMGVGFLLYLLSVGSNVFGQQNSMF